MLEEILFTNTNTTDTNDDYTNKDKLTTPNGANSSSENESGFVFFKIICSKS
jgi:hypothetical protein